MMPVTYGCGIMSGRHCTWVVLYDVICCVRVCFVVDHVFEKATHVVNQETGCLWIACLTLHKGTDGAPGGAPQAVP